MKFYFLILNIIITFNLFSFSQIGIASWYGPNFHGKLTANGERFNTYALTAAHKTLPLNSIVEVTSLTNNKKIFVRINDRGPFAKGRIIDLSKAAAAKLGIIKDGTMKVKVDLIKKGDGKYYRYNGKKYKMQIISFNSKEKAFKTARHLLSKKFPVIIEAVKVKEKKFYRISIKNLTYYKLQKYKVMLHNEGLHNYLIKTL